MFKNQNVIYSPYGAYELKATYQRNLLKSALLVNTFFVSIVLFAALYLNSVPVVSESPSDDPVIIDIRIQPVPPITGEPPLISVRPPNTDLPAGTIPVPVEDELSFDEEAEVITVDDFAEFTTDGAEIPNGISAEIDFLEGIGDMPGLNAFVPNVQIPQFIFKALPEYPRLEKTAEIEGTVWIAVEVAIDGNVINAKIYSSSGRDSFDQAALAVATKNKFRPAIQNGIPVKLWTAYKVEFVLSK